MSAALEARARLRALDDERRGLEAEIAAQLVQLGPLGMESPLVDSDGFPRSDADLLAVRTARQAVVMRRNDLRRVEGELAAALEALHALGPAALAGALPAAAEARSSAAAAATAASAAAFAVVDSVSPGSPAAAAGLTPGDKILQFGDLAATLATRPTLQDVAAVVRASEGAPVALRVLRGGATVELSLTPARWAGQGLLGCHVLPLAQT